MVSCVVYKLPTLLLPSGDRMASGSLSRFASINPYAVLECPELENVEENLCCICLSNPASCILKPCAHDEFCVDCVTELLDRDMHARCPVCRFSVISLAPKEKDFFTYLFRCVDASKQLAKRRVAATLSEVMREEGSSNSPVNSPIRVQARRLIEQLKLMLESIDSFSLLSS